MFQFSLFRAFSSLVLLAILVFIALYIRDGFVRPFMGDILVVIWLYITITAVANLSKVSTVIGVLIFAYLIELAQWLDLLSLLGMEHNSLLNVVFGATFDWLDLFAYTIGGVICWLGDKGGFRNQRA